jgi:Tol biopolymer transport system component
MQSKRNLIAVIFLIATILACANPLPVNIGTPGQPANVETIVAATFAALTASAPETTATPPPATSDLLPASLYFLNADNSGSMQVYRLDQDGETVTQITFEPAEVETYDVSLSDGSVVYVSNNQLLVVEADGRDRKLLVDGGPVDLNNAYLTKISSPVWSPDAQTIAYGHKGLNLYTVGTGRSELVIENKWRQVGNNLLLPDELYWPDHYSPDGSKLLITLAYYEGASAAIYRPADDTLVRLKDAEGALICCGEPNWSPDGASLFTGNPSMGMFAPGLWQVDAAIGQVTTLLAGDPGDGTFNFADEPILAPDGQLYYFYANLPSSDQFINRIPLQLVRSEPDGVTDRTQIRSESFDTMNEALWAPDASFVIVANAPNQDVYQGGMAELYYTDGQKDMVSLVPFVMNMKWGP